MEDLIPYKPTQEFEEECSKNGSGVLIISNHENTEPCIIEKMDICAPEESITPNFSKLSDLIAQNENINLNQDTSETTSKCSPHSPKQQLCESEELLTHQTDTMDEIIQGSPSDRISPDDIQKSADEIRENEQPSKTGIKEPISKMPKDLKKLRMNKHRSGEEENEAFSKLEGAMVVEEVPKKNNMKKANQTKEYTDLINVMQHMFKINWFEGSTLSQKHLDQKHMTQNVLWFIICANYFQRAPFAGKTPKEAIHHEMTRLQNFMPDIFKRIDASDIQPDVLLQSSESETGSLLLEEIHQAIKAYSDSFPTEAFQQRTISPKTVNAIPKPAYTSCDDEWLMEIRRFLFDQFSQLKTQDFLPESISQDIFENLGSLSKIDLQDLITLYEKDFFDMSLENQKLLDNLETKLVEALEEEQPVHMLKFDPNCSIGDLRFDFPEDEVFIELLEKKQNEAKTCMTEHVAVGGKSACNKPGSSFKPKIMIDDMVCYVCNDGDYTDDDLIVFCSRCNMSVHQQCYGIAVIPKGDWICDVCLNFGENGKYLRCPLCDKRGGAMKPTCTRIDTDMFESLNPSFHTFIKSYATEEFIRNATKTKYLNLKNLKDVVKNQDSLREDEGKDDDDESDTNFSEQLYYDIQFLDENFTEEELVNEPKPAYIWAHMTCAVFVPELYFGDHSLMTNILGLENVSKERFKYECEVCGKKKNGSIINCEKSNCKKAFHPECARRANYYLDIKENEFDQLVYNMFCEKHMPLKLRRTLESRDKKMKEDITKYFKTIEKFCLTAQHTQFQNITDLDSLLVPEPKRKYERKEEGKDFLNLIEQYKEITAQGTCSILLQKTESEENDSLYEILEVIFQKQNLAKDRKLTADDDIWSVLPCEGLTPEQKYKKYREIMNIIKKKDRVKQLKKEIYRRNIERARDIKQQIADKAKPGSNNNKAKNAKTDKNKKAAKKATEVFCICKQIYHGELMIQCGGCEQWYHPPCVKIPGEVNLEMVEWWCQGCSKKLGWKDVDFLIKDKIGKEEILQKKRVNCEELEEEEPEMLKKLKTKILTNKKSKKGT